MMESVKKLITGGGLFVCMLLGACDDNLTPVGTTVQPPGDLITVYTDTFLMTASTVKLDSIFAKTTTCMVGEIYDPVYGLMKSDFLCQFYCEEGYQFPRTPHNGAIDSIHLIMIYSYNSNNGVSAFGDTLTPMQATAYLIDRPLKRNFYTNDDPALYCDMQNPLGSITYTAYDMSVPDSVREAYDSEGYSTYYPYLRIKLPVEFGQKIYDETILNPSSFESQSAFNQFFPGIYLTTTYGSGCLLLTQGENVYVEIYYHEVEKGSEGQDTVLHYATGFKSSKDVFQINRFQNSHIDQLLEPQPDYTYIKAPAGVYTRLVIPATEISKKLDVNDRYINGFSLSLKYLPEDERNFAYSPPSFLLLLPEDSIITFFENIKVEDNLTSFVSFMYDATSGYTSTQASPYGYNPSTRTFSFGNISALLKAHIENSPDEDLRLLVIPVYRETTTYSSMYYTMGITHTLIPAGLKIRTDGDLMKIVVLSSKFEDRQ